MCGIFGYVGEVSQEKALSCLIELEHRGPDGSGVWSEPGITLGHRRLSILDLSENGKQPMSSIDGRYQLTFNGEIYNFIEIRQDLEKKGYRFKSQSDSEVILASFHAWGVDCLNRFNGMWAFAIWDRLEKSLFLARDRIGKKPLFYTRFSNGDFAFASEMKALFPLLNEVKANKSLVMDHKRIFTYENTEECLVEGLFRFPSGYYGWLKNGVLSKSRWWCTLDHLVSVPSRYEEQVEQFDALFQDACRIRMRSDVPIGTALSGGLDSSATISVMAHLSRTSQSYRMGRDWQHAFVASFPGTPLDETHYAKIVADYLGIDANVVNIDPLSVIGDLDKYSYLFEDIYITSPIPFMMTYQSVKSQGISVTLDGHGADELFGGYSFDYLSALSDAGWDVNQAFEIIGTYFDGMPKNSEQFAKLPSKIRYFAEFHLRRCVNKMRGRSVNPSSRDSAHPAWSEMDQLNRQLYVSTHETVLPTLLRNYDRYSMANGVEIRMPFLDHRILSFAFSIPWSSKIRNGFSKAIIRDAVAKYMPPEIAYRKTKIGFNSPVIDWIKGPLKNYLLQIIESDSFNKCELIDPIQVRTSVKNVIDDPRAKFIDGERVWIMLTPYFWERSVIKKN
jgi:asparagine synthase (glutamine-hydrolysing)